MRNMRIFGLRVSDIIDNIVDHNSVVALWENDASDEHYMNLLWKGVGWTIPDPYNNYKFVRIYSAVADSIENSNVVNIEVHR